MRKTEKTHPFLVKAELPKGHAFGYKHRTHIRNTRFKTRDESIKEKNALQISGATIVLVYEKKQCIFNSTTMK